MSDSPDDRSSVYAQTLREMRVRDPLAGRTEASLALAKADRAWKEKKAALAALSRDKEKS